MIARSMTFAAQLTRTWVAMYTAGLPEELACTRRDEIESDLWEQERWGVSNGEALARLALGMPADVSWRLEQRRAAAGRTSERKERSMIDSTSQKAFVGVAWLMAAFTTGIAALVAFGMGGGEVLGADVPRSVWGIVGVIAGATILAGLQVRNAFPMWGGVLVLAGAFPLAFLMVWSILVPALWLLLAALLVVSAMHNQDGATSV